MIISHFFKQLNQCLHFSLSFISMMINCAVVTVCRLQGERGAPGLRGPPVSFQWKLSNSQNNVDFHY